MSAGAIGCWTCGSGNRPEAKRCWVCHADLNPSAPRPAAAPLPHASSGSVAGMVIGWFLGLICLFVVSLLVAIEIAIHWPGLLVPYALVSVVVLSVLAVSAYGQIRHARRGKEAPSAGATLIYGVVLGTTTVVLGLALIVLLYIAAIVVMLLVCFAMIAANGH